MKNIIVESPSFGKLLIKLAELISLNDRDFNTEDKISVLLQNSIEYINKLQSSVSNIEIIKEPKVKKVISQAKRLGEELNQTMYSIEDVSALKKKNNKLMENLNKAKVIF